MFTHGRCSEKNPTAKLYHKTSPGSIRFEAGNNRVLSCSWKHLLETINQVPSGAWYNISVPSSSSTLIFRLSFRAALFWKWHYT
ncbi:unnamed protein product [Prunus brigantina]